MLKLSSASQLLLAASRDKSSWSGDEN